MCGRYTAGNPESIAARYGFVDLHETKLEPRFNVAPSQVVAVVVGGPDGPVVRPMRWGFQPSWMKEPRRPPPINARAEGILESRLFGEALARGRCIIPADGFYEWVAVPGQRGKQPMHFRLRGGGAFGFAGLYTSGPDGQETYAIITTAANQMMVAFHHRMPVILDAADEPLWLDPATTDPRAVLACLRALPAERLEAFPVGPQVSAARNDSADLIRPAGADAPAKAVGEVAYQPDLFGDLT